jgi:GAF domain-containing protein
MEATLLSGGILSYAVVPLMAEGELIGFPNLGSDTTGGFSREHCGIALELGDVLAVAIDQSLTEAQLRRHLEESQRRLSELTSQT